MATITPDSIVAFKANALPGLAYPPDRSDGAFTVAVNPFAMKVPHVALTTVVQRGGSGSLLWVASLDESLIDAVGETSAGARAALAACLLSGADLWTVVQPGELRIAGPPIADTVYQGDRPWVVIGEAGSAGVLAVPLNDAGGGDIRQYQHLLRASDLVFPGSKDSRVELNHVWSFPRGLPLLGSVDSSAVSGLADAIKKEFGR